MTTPDRRKNATAHHFGQKECAGRDRGGRTHAFGMGGGPVASGAPQPQVQGGSQSGAPQPQPGAQAAPAAPGGPAAPQPGGPASPSHRQLHARPQGAGAEPQALADGKRKRGAGFWVAIVVAAVAVVVACLLALTLCDGAGKGARQGSLGQLEGKTQEEIQAELDRVVDEGMFNISIASTVEFPTGTSEGDLRIENVPGNRYLMRVVITRDDTNEQIYETDLIEPNHHIQADTLDADLPADTYECTATFFAYEPDTEELAGQAAAKISISVLA